MVLAELARTTGGQDILHVARDGQRLERLQDGLRFFAPEREVLVFPAWDCLPYDRLSPHPDIVAERLETMARLADAEEAGRAGAHRPRLGRRGAAEGAAAQPLCRGGQGPAQGRDRRRRLRSPSISARTAMAAPTR